MTQSGYRYETPPWAARALCLLAFLLATGSAVLAYYWNAWGGNAPAIIRWLLVLMAVVFAAAALNPRHWKAWCYFRADHDGLWFPSECPQTGGTRWLQVPWSSVLGIEAVRFYDRFPGVELTLALRDDAIDTFFRDLKLKNRILGQARENGASGFKVGYSSSFQNTDRAVATLRKLWRRYGDSR